MISRAILILICLIFSCFSVEAKAKGPKWIYHVATEKQTVEQIVRGYSVLYDVDLERFLEWNNLRKWDVPSQGDIFMIANKPSKGFIAAQKEQQRQEKIRKQEEKRKETLVRKKPKVAKKETRKNVTKAINIKDEDIRAAIRFAGDYSGVRHAFLAGMLDVETGLGKYTGSCHYKESKMGPPEQQLFEEICEELGYDPDQMSVSCSLKGQRGGGMGVAQFLPSTWKVYQTRISKVVDKRIPDPWNPKDAAVAMALKVANDAPDVIKHSKKAEMVAAKMYLSGTTDSKYNSHARKVLAAAKKYEGQF